MFKYKDYIAEVFHNEDEDCLSGRFVNFPGMGIFYGDNLEELKSNFQDMVDDYLKACEEHGHTPEKPDLGEITVELSPQLEFRLLKESVEKNMTVEDYLVSLITNELNA